jgi:ribonuclease HII
MRLRPNCVLEQELWSRGVTALAVGVGALAGPVMAAAVILAPDAIVDGLEDSKLLTPERRETLFAVISERAVAIGIGQVTAEEVDRLNLYWAAMEARRRVVDALPTRAAHILSMASAA